MRILRAAGCALLGLLTVAAHHAPDAEELFSESRFDEAAAAAADRLAKDPKDAAALEVAGQAALLSLRLAEAERHLRQLVAQNPGDAEARKLLAETYRRLERYADAAPLYRAAGKEALALQSEALADKTVYRLDPPIAEARIPFVLTDPLPFVNVRVNGGEEALFLIDTGAGRTVVDPELAAKAGIASLGADTSVFAGGKEATFDLRPRGAAATIAGAREIPFWLGGDHLILAWGALRGHQGLFLVDTGLAGAAFTAPRSMLAAAGVELGGPSLEGEGGGGKVTVTPFAVKDLSLGDVRDDELLGIGGAFPESLERSEGYRIAGLISHTFFRQYALTFDFDGRKLLLVKP